MNYQKNQLVTIKIEDIGADGEGIGKIDGFPLFEIGRASCRERV